MNYYKRVPTGNIFLNGNKEDILTGSFALSILVRIFKWHAAADEVSISKPVLTKEFVGCKEN